MGQPALDFISTMATKAGSCPIERSAFVRITSQRLYTSNMKAVANMILANAPFAPGPRLLPLTMLAPVHRPMASSVTLTAEAATVTPEGAVVGGPLGRTHRGRPAWLSTFLVDVKELPAAERPDTTPLPVLLPRVPPC